MHLIRASRRADSREGKQRPFPDTKASRYPCLHPPSASRLHLRPPGVQTGPPLQPPLTSTTTSQMFVFSTLVFLALPTVDVYLSSSPTSVPSDLSSTHISPESRMSLSVTFSHRKGPLSSIARRVCHLSWVPSVHSVKICTDEMEGGRKLEFGGVNSMDLCDTGGWNSKRKKEQKILPVKQETD